MLAGGQAQIEKSVIKLRIEFYSFGPATDRFEVPPQPRERHSETVPTSWEPLVDRKSLLEYLVCAGRIASAQPDDTDVGISLDIAGIDGERALEDDHGLRGLARVGQSDAVGVQRVRVVALGEGPEQPDRFAGAAGLSKRGRHRGALADEPVESGCGDA